MRALVVEDEARIAEFVEYGLTAEGFVVETVGDGVTALERALQGGFDVIVLDLMLPGLTGEQVLRQLRGRGDRTPVVVLTAKDAVLDRVENLNAGADDYLVKPFSFAELLARIRARVRAPAEQAGGSGTVLEHGPLRLDLPRRRVWRDENEVTLTNREFALLEVFLRHPGQVLSQPQLLDLVWGYGHDAGSNVVEVYVSYLRRKLGADVVETVRGGGYRCAEFAP